MNIRDDFPFLKQAIYLDAGAGTLKPQQVIQAMDDFYVNYPVNAHSQDSIFGIKVLQAIAGVRQKVAQLVAAAPQEVIFTSGTTDSLNKIALMLAPLIKAGDQILLSPLNHASNWVPFVKLAQDKQAQVVSATQILDSINSRTKIIALAQLNNTIDTKDNLRKIFIKAQKVGAIVINDAAQAIIHQRVSLAHSHVIAFSGNKIYGPTGIGALVVRKSLLTKLQPMSFGGGATVKMSVSNWLVKNTVEGFEPGSLNTAGIIGLGAAIDYFQKLPHVFAYELQLANYAYDQLQSIVGIKFYSQRGDTNVVFNIDPWSAQDIVSYLGHQKILLRAGLHCAKMAAHVLGTKTTIRLSLAAYNNHDDIDQVVRAIKKGGDFLEFI